MNNDAVNQRLDNAIHGKPELNIDQKRIYLGTIRERVFLVIKNNEMSDPTVLKTFASHYNELLPYHILINDKIDHSLLDNYVKLCSAKSLNFSIINDDNASTDPEANGVVVTSDEAINEDIIAIKEKYPIVEKLDEKHESFFDKIFKF